MLQESKNSELHLKHQLQQYWKPHHSSFRCLGYTVWYPCLPYSRQSKLPKCTVQVPVGISSFLSRPEQHSKTLNLGCSKHLQKFGEAVFPTEEFWGFFSDDPLVWLKPLYLSHSFSFLVTISLVFMLPLLERKGSVKKKKASYCN